MLEKTRMDLSFVVP